MLQSAPLETLTVDFHENVRDNAFEELAASLKNFPSLKHLSLNFDSDNAQTSDRGLSKLALAVQKLKSLSSLAQSSTFHHFSSNYWHDYQAIGGSDFINSEICA